MHYNIIDMADDPRSGQFAYFRGMTFPFAGLTVEMDITDMMAARGERPFFLSLLYAVVRAANSVPQLRRRHPVGRGDPGVRRGHLSRLREKIPDRPRF